MPDQTNGVLKRDHEDIMVFRRQFAVCLCLAPVHRSARTSAIGALHCILRPKLRWNGRGPW